MSLSVQTAGGKKELSLRAKIRAYQRRAAEMKEYLDRRPNEWGRFQSEFNQEINGIFRDIMIYEKENLAAGREDKVYRLKRLFINRFRREFAYGTYVRHSLEKPYGHTGDFKIIDDMYRNDPETDGFARLFDNYTQMSAAAISIRNRKKDFQKMILSFVASKKAAELSLLDLAAGPCRDLAELFEEKALNGFKISVDCYDQEAKAIAYAKNLLGKNISRVSFIKENVLRLALKKNIEEHVKKRYDLIFSTGLFDYLDHGIAVRLVANLKKLLNRDGEMIIASVRAKFQNPSVFFLEWVGDWNLVYRTEESFKQIFLEAGFEAKQLTEFSEQSGIFQYIVAKGV